MRASGSSAHAPRAGAVDAMAAALHSPAERLRIGGFVLDRTRRELLTLSGSPAELRHKALEVLLMLGAQAGHVVSKDDLLLHGPTRSRALC